MYSGVAIGCRTYTAAAGKVKTMLCMLLVACAAFVAAVPVAAEIICTIRQGGMGEPAWEIVCTDDDNTDENETQTTYVSPAVILFVTQRGNNAHESAVLFDTDAGRWAIVNQDLAPMPIGIAFHVRSTPAGPSVFVHQATSANTSGSSTAINHLLTNDRPNVLLQVTQRGIANPHTIGVRYNGSTGRWVIFNQDGAPMPAGAAFNVEVTNAGESAAVHRATTANTFGSTTYIDLPPLHGNPDAIILVTQNWNPGGGSGIGNPHTIALRYDKERGRWAIFNQDGAPMPIGASFNLHFALSETV